MKISLPLMLIKLLRRIKAQMPSEKRSVLAQTVSALEREKRVKDIADKLFVNCHLRILSGPFEGMLYIPNASGSQLLPKLIGSYEEPLHEWVNEILNVDNYSSIIDVGCAEGYYAVGFARAKSNPKVFGFDVDETALERAKKLANANNISGSIEFHKTFDNEVLSQILRKDQNGKVLIFMDVEGAELNLLDPTKCPSILNCDILVELHDCFYPQLTESVIGYLRNTHSIKINVDYPWRKGDYSVAKNKVSEGDLMFAMDEVRPDSMRWIYAVKK